MFNRFVRYLLLLMSLLMTAILLNACATEQKGTVTIAGSTSVQPLARELADMFISSNPKIEVDIQGVGSTAGIKAVSGGTCDIGSSSRELKDEEKKLGLTEHIIAIDGIAVIVNPNNTVEGLTKDQILGVYKGEIKNWKELGGADKVITVVSREAGSGTRGAFEELLELQQKDGDKTISLVTEDALIANGNSDVIKSVNEDDNAIGYISLGMVDESVKALDVDGVKATVENIRENKYPISRPFILLTKGNMKSSVKALIDFIMSEEGQNIVSKDYIQVK